MKIRAFKSPLSLIQVFQENRGSANEIIAKEGKKEIRDFSPILSQIWKFSPHSFLQQAPKEQIMPILTSKDLLVSW